MSADNDDRRREGVSLLRPPADSSPRLAGKESSPRYEHDEEIIKEMEELIMTRSDSALVKDVTIDWMYKPHSLIAMLVVIVTIAYLGFTGSDPTDSIANLRRGIYVAIFCFLVPGMLYLPSGSFVRPHPVLWRLVFGVSVVYFMFIVVLLFQNAHDARMMLKYVVSPTLGVPLVERSYAENCDVTWANIRPALFDRYVLAHSIGWMCKAIALRDRSICWTASIFWELVELALTFAFPNFAECWWDQWVLDVLLANGIGIEIGIFLCNKLEAQQYRWSGIYTYPTLRGKFKRLAMQFTPESWVRVRWHELSNVKRFLAVNFVILCLSMVELNAFALKQVLWIPPENNTNIFRLVIWFTIGVSALRQYYVYLADPRCKRLGTQAVLALCIIVAETLVSIKFGEYGPPPDNVKRWASMFLMGYLSFCALVLMTISQKGRKKKT